MRSCPRRAGRVAIMLAQIAVFGCSSGQAASESLSSIDPALAKVQREVWDVWFAGDTVRLKEIIPPGSGGDQQWRSILELPR